MGIANIINTAGGGGGGGSEIITNLVNSVDGAGLRLANSASIKCNDVAANRFGTADFSIELVISQNAESVNSDIFTSSADYSTPSNPQAKSAALIRWDVSGNGNLSLVFFNSTGTGTTYDFGVSLTADVDKPTHFVVSADRSANAVLFRNGAEVASVDISASSSENIGVGGYPAVVGLPNTLGFKGNIYRLRTYSKLLSSDEAKNVFDRADVPTALVSNLLLDLDCAYANPTQSTVIQDKGPNNQDGTLNGTITQTNVIKQLNSTSARIGTSAGTPADRELLLDKFLTFSDNGGTITSDNAEGEITIAGGNATNNGGNISLRGGSHGTPNTIRMRVGSSTALTISSTGSVNVSGPYLNVGGGYGSTGLSISDAGALQADGLATFSNGIAVSGAVASFANGIYFSSQTGTDKTGASTSTSVLDHYEEGTWTCTLNGVTGGNTTAYYTRVGDIVTVWFYSGAITSDGSAATISGLPFTVSGAAYGGFFCFHNTYAPTANSGYFAVNTVTGNFTADNATATASSANASGRYLMFTGVYKVA